MPIDWTLDDTRGVVRLVYSGPAVHDEWIAAMRDIFAHPAYRPGFGFVALVDDAHPPDSVYIQRSAAFIREHAATLGDFRWANVTKRPAHYGMTRVAQAHSDDLPGDLAVFDNEATAILWAMTPRRSPLDAIDAPTLTQE